VWSGESLRAQQHAREWEEKHRQAQQRIEPLLHQINQLTAEKSALMEEKCVSCPPARLS
jgi:uncharacterized protein (DUF3084 family)